MFQPNTYGAKRTTMCIVVADPQHATNVCTFKRVVARWWGNKKISLSTVNNNKKKQREDIPHAMWVMKERCSAWLDTGFQRFFF
jgi:hypothetical protein